MTNTNEREQQVRCWRCCKMFPADYFMKHICKEVSPTPVAAEVELPAEAFRSLELEVENKETIERIKVKIKALIDEKEALKAENAKLKARIQELERELKAESKASAIEKTWQERQGEDYGSY